MDIERFRRKSPPPSSNGFSIRGFSDVVEIARGGFGTVYRAQQPAYRRTVAIKVLQASLDGKTRERFERECMALGSLSGHPNIVTLFDSGLTSSGQPYIVMEYLAGGSLEERLRRSSPMPWHEAVQIGIKLAGALHTAHQAGVLHRDIKPRNVLVSSFGECRLVDFGLARLKGAMETRVGEVAASLAYAAPEIINGQPPSVASDLYSLGATIFTLIWGRPPFVGDDDELEVQVIARIAAASPPDLRVLGVPNSVCEVLERVMAKEPERRFRSAEEFGKALQAIQGEAGMPVTPLPLKQDVEDWATAGSTEQQVRRDDQTVRRPLSEGPAGSVGGSNPAPAGRWPDHSVTDRTVVRPPVGASSGWSPPPPRPPGPSVAPPEHPPRFTPPPASPRAGESPPRSSDGLAGNARRVPRGPVAIAAAAMAVVVLLLGGWLVLGGGGSDPELGPSSAAQEGRYRFRKTVAGDVPTTLPGTPTGDTIATVATSSRSADEVRQTITFDDPDGTSERVVRMWRKDGLYEDETVRVVDGRESVCDWQPDVPLLKFPVVKNARWTTEVSCRDAGGFVLERLIESRVAGSSTARVQGKSVRVWTIERSEKRRLLQASRLVALQDVTMKELFAPAEGLFVQVAAEFKTTPQPGTTVSQLSYELRLLNRKPI